MSIVSCCNQLPLDLVRNPRKDRDGALALPEPHDEEEAFPELLHEVVEDMCKEAMILVGEKGLCLGRPCWRWPVALSEIDPLPISCLSWKPKS
ncbi:hypothetical protein TIFTF001_016330 [Ficus carica]|uniref:Uncharacterized protein n=1 Tax=Ficus carica TaxID=3494 RepID=A0AA88A7K1_FICCA|nr:hypothetical protein TIFTF001_016330 [Ficus carica]